MGNWSEHTEGLTREQIDALREANLLVRMAHNLISEIDEQKLNRLGFHFPAVFGFAGVDSNGNFVEFSVDTFLDFIQPQPEPPPPPNKALRIRWRREDLLPALGKETGWRCSYCHETGSPELGPDGRSWHLDHGYPKILGGDEHPDNRILSCATCNIRKNKKTVMEYMRGKLEVWERGED